MTKEEELQALREENRIFHVCGQIAWGGNAHECEDEMALPLCV